MHLAVSLAGRRALLGALAAAAASCGGRAWASSEAPLSALSDASLGYALVYPEGWAPSPKPVKTHLSESLLKGPAHKAQLGLTVDPVKIDSLEQFGSLQQVTERVLAVEETRDGVQAVELRSSAAETGSPTYYVIEYAVASSRGKKMYLCKYCICNKRLYVLQTQAALDDYETDADGVRSQLQDIVRSFRVSAA